MQHSKMSGQTTARNNPESTRTHTVAPIVRVALGLTTRAVVRQAVTIVLATSLCEVLHCAPFVVRDTIAAGTAPDTVLLDDIDGDGLPDLVVANQKSDDISLRLNQGGGLFGPERRLVAGDDPFEAALADFDGDSDLDIAVVNYFDNTFGVLKNDGNGDFAPQTLFPVGTLPTSIAVADFDKDGDIDIAVTNLFANDVSLLLNAGDASFAPDQRSRVGSFPTRIRSGDLDGDGDQDLAVTNLASDDVSLLINAGDANFTVQRRLPINQQEPIGLGLADVNGDHSLDIVVASTGGSNAAGGITININAGSGEFAAPSTVDAGADPVDVAIDDIDGDTDHDLLIANEGDGTVTVLANDGAGAFDTVQTVQTGDEPRNVALGDLDADGDLDAAIADGGSDSISILANVLFEEPTCLGDANTDLLVDLADLLVVLDAFGLSTDQGPVGGDVTDDGTVDLEDLLVVLARFGANCDA